MAAAYSIYTLWSCRAKSIAFSMALVLLPTLISSLISTTLTRGNETIGVRDAVVATEAARDFF